MDSSSYVPCVVQLSDPELWKWCARRMEGMDQSRSSRGIGLRRLAGEEAEWAELEWAELEWAELEWESDACPRPPGVTGWPPPRTLPSYGELFSRRGGLDPSLKMFRRPSESSTRPSPCRDGMRVGWYCSGPEEMEAGRTAVPSTSQNRCVRSLLEPQWHWDVELCELLKKMSHTFPEKNSY